MDQFLLYLLFLEVGAMLAWGLARKGRIYEYPFLAAAVFAGWALPQIYGIYLDPEGIPAGGVAQLLLMAFLSLGAIHLGYLGGRSHARLVPERLDERTLLAGAAAFIVIGGLFQLAFLRLEDKQFVEGGLTGIGTVYVFMTKLVTVGFGIALLRYLRTRQRLALMLLLLGGLFFFEKIVLSGRRAQMAELLLVTGLAFWYVRGRAIPRVLMIAALVAGAFVVAAIGQYRAVVLQEDPAAEIEWGDVAEIDFVGAFQGYVAEGPELRIAARDIAGLSRTGTFDYGLSQWNGLVFGFVPAQFVGRDLKDSLMVNLDNTKVLEESLFGASGATRTGLSDAFASFWYFGALIFFAIGWWFGRLHGSAMRGDVASQVMVMALTVQGLHAITHGTTWFVKEVVYVLIFLLPVFYLARRKGNAFPSRLESVPGQEAERLPTR